MIKGVAAALLAMTTLASTPLHAEIDSSRPFWAGLDRNGVLSAGWVQVLPVLASACKLKLDNRELNSKLVDLSEVGGNTSYATDLYWHLYLMDQHKAKNTFVRAWQARFGDNQQEACATAERLWGNAGKQFPGVLVREAVLDNDATSTIPPNAAPNCR